MLKFMIDQVIEENNFNKDKIARRMGISMERFILMEKENFGNITSRELFDLCHILKISPLLFTEHDFSLVNHRFAKENEKDELITRIIPDLMTYSSSALEAVSLLNETSLIALNELVSKVGSSFMQYSDFDEDEYDDAEDEFLS